MPRDILVYGWYGNGNVGDELFRDVFRRLDPHARFTFVDKITHKDLHDKRAIIFGGGSFLYKEPRFESLYAFERVKNLPKAYIGVGIETEVHPTHVDLMKNSSFVSTRTQEGVKRLRELGIDAISTPDIVHLIPSISATRKQKSMMFVTNVETVPTWNAPSWALLAWERFKNETAQFLDERLEQGWSLSFFSMCKNSRMNDLWPAYEIVSKMTRRSTKFEMLQGNELSTEDVLKVFSKHTIVLSQRYHGLVLSEMVNTPSISIHHHDKLKFVDPFRGEKVSYYELCKRPLHAAVDLLEQRNFVENHLDFSELLSKFESFLKEVDDGQVRRNS